MGPEYICPGSKHWCPARNTVKTCLEVVIDLVILAQVALVSRV